MSKQPTKRRLLCNQCLRPMPYKTAPVYSFRCAVKASGAVVYLSNVRTYWKWEKQARGHV